MDSLLSKSSQPGMQDKECHNGMAKYKSGTCFYLTVLGFWPCCQSKGLSGWQVTLMVRSSAFKPSWVWGVAWTPGPVADLQAAHTSGLNDTRYVNCGKQAILFRHLVPESTHPRFSFCSSVFICTQHHKARLKNKKQQQQIWQKRSRSHRLTQRTQLNLRKEERERKEKNTKLNKRQQTAAMWKENTANIPAVGLSTWNSPSYIISTQLKIDYIYLEFAKGAFMRIQSQMTRWWGNKLKVLFSSWKKLVKISSCT